MAKPWVIVGGTGYDVEEVAHPQTRDMLCPGCEKHVRFVEKELVKNLRVFGVPLVGLEKGQRVFECPRCGVCIEPPAEEATPEPVPDAARAALEARRARAEDELWLWRQRADLAIRKGEKELATEALRFAEHAERELSRVQAELAAPVAATVEPKRPPPVTVESSVEDEFAALKRRLAAQPAPPPPVPEPEPAAVPSAPPPAAPPPAPEPAAYDEEAFAALKRRLAERNAAPAEPAPPAAPEPAADTGERASAEGEDDAIAALKRKLRGPRG
jgi:hypothetical protein